MNVESTRYLVLTPADTADTRLLRQAFGTFATGVTVLTVGGHEPHGMTANSFTTVSLRPPLVLVCIDRGAVMHERMEHGSFAVSVLSSEQESVARFFADVRRPLGAAQFDGVDHEPGPMTGAPLITGALAHFECELEQTVDSGDHTIFIGRLLTLGWRPAPDDVDATDEALLFVRGRFRRFDREGGPDAV
jgi:flavin reductase (DIM6/NTAB) family NADH-FMN oxidoreductase RutF